ncbi:MAG: hypothetical protein ABIF10_03205, partial [Candidatus Woesearchaeota archaeon]
MPANRLSAMYLPRTTNSRISFLFIVCLAAHIIDSFVMGFSHGYWEVRLVMWLIMFILGSILLSQSRLDWGAVLTSFLLSLWSYLIPYTKTLLNYVLPNDAGNLIVVFAPVWIIYIVYMMPEVPGWLHWVGVGYLILWLVVFVSFAWQQGYFDAAGRTASQIGLEAAYIDVWEPVKQVWQIL